MNTYYNKNYARTIKPRYRADYKGKPCIITKDKAQIALIKKNYNGGYIISKIDERTFIIWLLEQI